jgi:dienelactone hydrolase
MFEQKRWAPEALAPVAAGFLWLWHAPQSGVFGFLIMVLPGCLLLASGVSTLLYPGDLRIPQFTALGAVLGALLAVPVMIAAGFWTGLLLVVLAAASFVAAGATSVRQEPHTSDVPEPVPSLPLALQVAIDDTILATMALRGPIHIGGTMDRIRGEIHQARELFRERGWLADPLAYHRRPPALEQVASAPRQVAGDSFEHFSWESGYEPDALEPGCARWLSYAPNRTAHAWVMRHRDGPRPWLLCIHGYEMGIPFFDLAAFRARTMHRVHGMNVALAVLPLHGPRRVGKRSGQGFLAGNFLDTVHAEAQAMWDLRRLLSWIRSQQGDPIGVYGLSLGGYNTALLAALDDGLACAVAGIPATDFRRLTWRHGPPLQIRYAEHRGLVHDEVSEVLSVISPLALAPKVARERRYIFAGVSDRLVPPDQPRDLWRHWERPRIEWYQGAHVTFRAHPRVARLVNDALRESGLIRGQ